MLLTSFRTRGVNFAYLVGPPQTLTRQQGMEIHDAVCKKLGIDDISFRYTSSAGDGPTPAPQSRGFSITLDRSQGRGGLQLVIDNPSIENPVRILAQYTWPPSREHVFEDLDLAFEAVFDALGSQWEKVLAEARIRGQIESQGRPAAEYLTQGVLGFNTQQLETLGRPVSFAGVRFETAPGDPTHDDPLANPKREVNIEVLREDPRSLYVEFMAQWPQISSVRGGQSFQVDEQRIRTFESQPSSYLKSAQDWLTSVGLPLFAKQ